MAKSSQARKPAPLTLARFMNAEVEGDPQKDMPGEESDWLDLNEKIKAVKEVQLVDACGFGQPGEGTCVRVAKGVYTVQVRIMSFGRDRRVSRLRICSRARSAIGKAIGNVDIDSATVVCCDKAVIHQLPPDRRRLLANFFTNMQGSDDADTSAEVLANMVQATNGNFLWSNTGFGDGSYPIFELKDGAKRVGFEIEFIKPNTPYPFEVRASVKAVAHPGEALHWSKIEDIWDPAWEAIKKGDAEARSYFIRLTRGQRALLAIDIFNKALLHMGGINDVFLAFKPVIPEEILRGYRRLGAKSHARQFEKLMSLLRPVVDESDPSKKIKLWTNAMASNVEKARDIEDWFRTNMEEPDRIESFIVIYVANHANEFPTKQKEKRAPKSERR